MNSNDNNEDGQGQSRTLADLSPDELLAVIEQALDLGVLVALVDPKTNGLTFYHPSKVPVGPMIKPPPVSEVIAILRERGTAELLNLLD